MDQHIPLSLGSLQEKRVRDIWPTRDIIWIRSSANLSTALTVMKEKRILSLPVVDTDSNMCIGVIDVQEISFFIVSSFPSLDRITLDNLRTLQYEGKQFGVETTVGQAMAYARSYRYPSLPLFPFSLDSNIMDLMNVFSRGIHRVPVVDNKSQVLNFISQSDLARYLCENIYLLGEKGDQSISELGLSTKPVAYARGDAMALQAIDIMSKHRLSALPVVDLDGRLIGNFSASDLRGVGPEDFVHLLRPIGQVLALFNPKSLFPLTTSPDSTLEYALLKMAATKVHRLWVVDDSLKILGVITLTDIMKPFLNITTPMESTAIPPTTTATTSFENITPFTITPSSQYPPLNSPSLFPESPSLEFQAQKRRIPIT